MGETRVKKSKKASQNVEPIPATVSRKLEKLSLKDQPSLPAAIESSKSTSNTPTTTRTGSTTSTNEEDSSNESDIFASDPALIEVQNTSTKGLALFTTRKITPGTLLLSERPLIRLTQAEEDFINDSSSAVSPSFTRKFNLLPKPTQKSYLSLHDSEKSTFPKLKSIYYSNCYNLSGVNKPSDISPGGSCIGLTASRINHSCVPNVQFSFDERKGLMLFHAIRAIPKGKEVLGTYDSVFEVSGVRQRKMVMYYGFTCACEACVPPAGSEFWARSDERRKGMGEARRRVRECERAFGREERVRVDMNPVDALARLEGLLMKEGLCGLPLADVYRSLGKWADRMEDGGGVLRWREKELEVCVVCLGEGSGRVKGLRERIRKDNERDS